MSNRLLLVLITMAGAVVLAAVWVIGQGEPSSAGERGRPIAVTTPDRGSERPAAELAPSDPPAVGVEPLAPGSPDAEARKEAATAWEEELARGHPVAGRVVFPPDTPLDEVAFVVARGRVFEHGPRHRVAVASDGSFRVVFAEKTKRGRLELEARYLFLDSHFKLRIGEETQPVVLEPDIGGVLRGRLVLPEDSPVAPVEIVGSVVSLTGFEEDGGTWNPRVSRTAAVAEDLSYEFTALPVAHQYRVEVDPGDLEPKSVDGLRLRAADVSVIDLELGVGVTLAGRVVDEAGEPMEGIRVSASSERTFRWSIGQHRWEETDEEGGFRIRGLTPGKVTLSASSKGYEDAIARLGDLSDRHVEEGIELVLGRGASVAGRVLWPDGSPVANAVIEVEEERPRPREGVFRVTSGEPFRTEADGTFVVSGLGGGTYRVNARGTRLEEVTVVSRITGKERKRKEKTIWRASAEQVESGTTDLVLTLSTGIALSGRVVDDAGGPVESFRIQAGRSVQRGENWWTTEDEFGRRFDGAGGTFQLDGLQPGEWTFEATAPGHGAGTPIRLKVPEELRAVEFVLPRAASITGIVLDPFGAAVTGAEVRVRSSQDGLTFGPSSDTEKVETDAGGAFTVSDVTPGIVWLVARAGRNAPSEKLSIEVAPGAGVGGVELRLRVGGRITGEVIGASGRPLPRHQVRVANWSEDFWESYQTDASGRFVAEDLPPGTYHVSVEPSEEEVRAVAGKGAGRSAYEILERQKSVALALGETVHVVLAPPDVSPVRMHGRVVAGKRPLAGVHIWAHLQGGDAPSPSSDTDDQGRYEITLPRSGKYGVQVSQWNTGIQYSTVADVPDVESFSFDIAFPIGSIAGRVLGPNGRPLAGIQVSAHGERAEALLAGRGTGSATTDEDGRYVMASLPAGTYTVKAGGTGNYWDQEVSDRSYTEDRVEGVVVAAEARVEGIDLTLAEGGGIEGVVRRADGTPVQHARIVARDAQGNRIGSWGIGVSDEAGRFRIHGLVPGTITVAAMDFRNVTPEEVPVEVRPDRVARLALELRPGTQLAVRVVDGAGEALQAELTLVDGKGLSHPLYLSSSKDAWRAGPLPPGTYTVRATHGAAESDTEVTLSGEASREVELRLE